MGAHFGVVMVSEWKSPRFEAITPIGRTSSSDAPLRNGPNSAMPGGILPLTLYSRSPKRGDPGFLRRAIRSRPPGSFARSGTLSSASEKITFGCFVPFGLPPA